MNTGLHELSVDFVTFIYDLQTVQHVRLRDF